MVNLPSFGYIRGLNSNSKPQVDVPRQCESESQVKSPEPSIGYHGIVR